MSLQTPSADTVSPTAAQSAAPLVLDAGGGGTVVVPGGAFLLQADYDRVGPDLVLRGANGGEVVVRGFFGSETPPDLQTEGGATISGALAAKLAGPLAPGQYAQAGAAAQAQPIGTVQTTSGTVEATRADGTTVTLNPGDPVFQGDTITTSADGAVGIIFNDNTTFSLSESGRMVLDEFIYDPGTQAGSSATSLVQGVFSFVSGQIAKSGADAMTVTTPVATIGIRGTTVAGRAAQEGEQNDISLLPDAGGTVGQIAVTNAGGTQVLNVAGQTVSLTSFNQVPPAPIVLPPAAILQQYATALAARPTPRTQEQQRQQEQQQQEQQEQQEQQQQQQGGEQQEGQAEGEAAEGELAEAPPPPEGPLTGDGLPGPEGLPPPPADFVGEAFGVPSGLPGAPGGFGPGAGQFVTLPPPPPPPPPSQDDDDEPDFIIPDTPASNDFVFLGDGGATFTGGARNDIVFGGGGSDVIDGGDGDDGLFGGPGDDMLIGGAGNDAVAGEGGNDLIVGGVGTGNDLYDGGPGQDMVSYASAANGVSVDLSELVADGPDIDFDILTNIEHVTGGAGNDQIFGSDADNTLIGGGGSDLIDGSNGNDFLFGNAGNDLIAGGDGNDVLIGGDGDDSIGGNGGDDLVIAGTGPGNDFYDGGSQNPDGFDRLTYENVTGNLGVFIDSGMGVASHNDGIDTFFGFEAFTGSNGDDTFVGSAPPNSLERFEGLAGDDFVTLGGNPFNSVLELDYRRSGAGIVVDFESAMGDGTISDGLGGTDTLSGISDVNGGGLRVRGTQFDDTYIGGGGRDRFRAEGGNDYFDGNGGIDEIDYRGIDGASNGVVVDLDAGTGSDGAGGTDTLVSVENARGSHFADTLFGSAADNRLRGEDGNDVLRGLDGNDMLEGGEGDDLLDGGNGIDTVSYQGAVGGVWASLATNSATGADGTDSLLGIENLTGGNFDDMLAGDVNDNSLSGLDGNDLLDGGFGNDTLFGGDGDDTLIGGQGNNFLDGGNGNDFASYAALAIGIFADLGSSSVSTGNGMDSIFGIENLLGGGGDDFISGSNGANTLVGLFGNDTIFGGDGDDVLQGDEGNDSLAGGFGNDSLFGGNGLDHLDGSDGNDMLFGGEGNDSVFGGNDIDMLVGGGGDDSLFGEFGDDVLQGDDGNDYMLGGSNDDSLFGGAGDDTLMGEDGNDSLIGGPGNDTIYGNDGHDDIEGGAGDDFLDGGSGNGFDDAIYANAPGPVTVDLNFGTASGADGNDTLVNFEGAVGSQFDDTLIGGSANDDFVGLGGNDTLFGDLGDDVLFGGMGNDTLTGGMGNDAFTYEDVQDLIGFTDTVTDFNNSSSFDSFVFNNEGGSFDFGTFLGGTASNGGFFFTSNDAYDGLAGTGVALSGTPNTSNDFFVLFNDSGNGQQVLYYDNDGSGSNFETVATIQGDTVDGNDIMITNGGA